MAYIEDSVLTAAVKAANSHVTALPAQWDVIIPKANRWAYNRVRGILMGRGYTATEVSNWGATDEEGQDWNERIGVLYAFWLASKSDEDRGRQYWEELKALLEELQEIPIIIDDELITPTLETGRIGSGTYDADDDDRHTIDDTFDGL